jgi:anti-anti-sigma factor
MEITHTYQDAVTVVVVTGSVDALTAPQLGGSLTQQIGTGRVNLVLDLARLDYISSAGLRAILGAAKEARQRGGDLRLAGVQPNVSKVFEMSGFTNILKFYADADAAAQSFSA